MAETEAPPTTEATEPRVDAGVDQLAAALAAVQAELPHIVAGETAKVTGETKAGKPVSYSYKYAGLATVAQAVLPLLGKHGLAFSSWPTLISNRFVLRYELLHSSGQRMGGVYPLSEDIRSPQAMGSQITYARRYCLCAVTGVSPDDDDDAAAAEGAKAAARVDQFAERDRERQLALDSIKGAWFNQYGEWNPTSAADMFETWSKGGKVGEANPQQLRAFAGYLHSLPSSEAGSDPNEATLLPPAGEQQAAASAEPKKMTKLQQGKIFASMSDLGMVDRQDQLKFMSDALGRTLKSRSEVTIEDAKVLIDILEEATATPPNVSDPAAGAQSAPGETRVPAGSETQPAGGQ